MMQIDNDTLRQIQMIQLELLVEVDRICKKCRIKYNIIAGTLLGAVRHGGYIPWDDDADVAFLRSEYERFRQAVKTELDDTRFYFQDNRRTKGYRWGYGKLRRKNTLFLREYQEHMPYKQGIFIDIFPLDGVPDNYILRSIKNFECFCVRKILWSKVGPFLFLPPFSLSQFLRFPLFFLSLPLFRFLPPFSPSQPFQSPHPISLLPSP